MVGLLGGRKAGLQDALPAQHGGVGGIQNADGGGAYGGETAGEIWGEIKKSPWKSPWETAKKLMETMDQ